MSNAPTRIDVESLAAELEQQIQEAARLYELYEVAMRRVEESRKLLQRMRRQICEANSDR